MNNTINCQSPKSSASINFYPFLNKYFFLLFGITYLSIVTITTISWNRLCPTSNSSWESTSSDSLENTTLVVENPNKFSTWFYSIIILGCGGTPWLLAYIFRHRAFLTNQKSLRRYPSASKAQKLKQRPISTPVLSRPKITNSHKSAPSYRISSFKSSPKRSASLSNNTKNIRLPFERLK